MKTLFNKEYLFLFTSLLTSFAANAQIIYKDVNPDQTFSANNSSFVLDLNNDAVDDFRISISMMTEPVPQNVISILPLYGSEYADISGTSASYPLPLQLNQSINGGLSWEGSGYTIISAVKNGSQWQIYSAWNGGPYYIGLRIHTSTQTLYGWVQLKATANASGASFTIYDYAYNSNFNQSVLSGQKCPPAAVITASGSISFCEGESVVLTANSGIGFTYKWMKDGVIIPGATDQSFIASVAGKYKVKVRDNVNGCTKTSMNVPVSVPCLGNKIEDLSSESNSISVYPNPVSEQFTLQSPAEGEVFIMSVIGGIVYEKKINAGTEVIDVSSFTKGLYLVSVNTSTRKYFSKFIKQ